MSNWISVKDRLPKEGELVLAYYRTRYCSGISVCELNNSCWDVWDDSDGNWLDMDEVTHWMPLPEPPQTNDPLT